MRLHVMLQHAETMNVAPDWHCMLQDSHRVLHSSNLCLGKPFLLHVTRTEVASCMHMRPFLRVFADGDCDESIHVRKTLFCEPRIMSESCQVFIENFLCIHRMHEEMYERQLSTNERMQFLRGSCSLDAQEAGLWPHAHSTDHKASKKLFSATSCRTC
jgi:hypothetical protein